MADDRFQRCPADRGAGHEPGPRRVPEYFDPSLSAGSRFFTTAATVRSLSLPHPKRPPRATGRKIGPSVMPDASSHALSARTE